MITLLAEETGHGEGGSLMDWLAAQPADPSFYTFLALIVFFALLLRMGVHKTLAKTLDDRANAISSELEEAKRLREDAAEMLASYQRKQREAEVEAEAIIAQAKVEAKSLKAEARKEMTERKSKPLPPSWPSRRPRTSSRPSSRRPTSTSSSMPTSSQWVSA